MVAIFIFSHIFSQEFNNGWTENGEQACPHSSNYLWELIWIPLCDNPYVPIPWLFELENTFFNCYILLKYYISYWLLFLQKAVKHWARTHFWKSIERCQEKMRKKVAIVPFSLLTVRAGVLHCFSDLCRTELFFPGGAALADQLTTFSLLCVTFCSWESERPNTKMDSYM